MKLLLTVLDARQQCFDSVRGQRIATLMRRNWERGRDEAFKMPAVDRDRGKSPASSSRGNDLIGWRKSMADTAVNWLGGSASLLFEDATPENLASITENCLRFIPANERASFLSAMNRLATSKNR